MERVLQYSVLFIVDYLYDSVGFSSKQTNITDQYPFRQHKIFERVPKAEKNDRFELGEVIEVSVTLVTYGGVRKTNGGDFVQIIVRSRDNTTSSVAYNTIDNRDGTYTCSVRLLWEGQVEVVGILVFPKEVIVADYRLRNEILSTHGIKALFKNGNTEEEHFCHPNHIHLMRRMNYSSVCNFTYLNSGIPWYCGRPGNINLLCNDWEYLASSGVGC
ncbi:NXPE family member 3-like [Mya arenaria]|uniref:NXPE family member 3-like n=1 Tax=Mya arenaria TaxID=6604 RepID=UPI0022E40F72|nr:NXPE family member 3-like [Mya arenaria]